ncbi:hypothetical protein LPTSP3_g31760 [Leptospira kobayashii]|uniref:PF04255 family protein n=1 Tax=Leptospira kobayashii TaxID=1917830 RepID=A0ABN6KHI8_9LEPT|nr:DUF433 domain-containing protein [Leptospira kobayashii]BDA80185.1 hypothetical protein LPTSP3_g31150 [Leptospira kobayashii]BDA80246.1 hypothetical protein LPTSP3_g31760 [Leptospira kobayashii]
MNYREHLSSSPQVMLGKPVIKNTRVTVELILERLGEGLTIEDILAATPNIRKEDIYACIAYSSDVISKETLLAS